MIAVGTLRMLAPLVLCSAGPALAEPRTDYMLHCQGCHLPDGGETPGKVPPLAGHIDRFLSRPGGREFIMRVPGVAQSGLPDARIAALLNWIVQEFGSARRLSAPLFTAAEVARYRQQPLTDPLAQRRAILAQSPKR
ncbi:c-type cytochrome [Sphingopyxis sp.]|uniref:c-type cytochrome n=1 Tax=Sphingopyxis sp. TaxID=1908224 RepID=UPI003D6C7DFF